MYDKGYSKVYISGWRYRELKAILMQYDERKETIKMLINVPGGISKGTVQAGTVSDPTAKAAERIAKLQQINDMIDYCISKVDQGDIMRKCLGYQKAVEAGYKGYKSEYYANKKKLFVLLNQKL